MPIYLSAGVYTIETDLSQIIRAAGASVGSIVFASDKGPLTPQFISNDKQFLDTFGNPNPLTSMAHYSALSFLQEARSMWALRVANNAGYPILVYNQQTGVLSQGQYEFTGTITTTSATITGIPDTTNLPIGGVLTAAGIPTGAKVLSKTTNNVVMDKAATSSGTVAIKISSLVDPESYTFNPYESFAIYPIGPGSYSENLSISVTPVYGGPRVTASGTPSTPALIIPTVVDGQVTDLTILDGGAGYGSSGTLTFTGSKGTGATGTYTASGGSITSVLVTGGGSGYLQSDEFQINVFAGVNLNTPVESWVVSKNYQKDGFGVQQYLSDRINSLSSRIRVYDNTSITYSPNADVSTPVKFSGGADGGVVGDSQLMTGWSVFANADEYTVNLMINGGYTSPAVQLHMAQVAESRGDSFAILDMPSASQAVANALVYRNSTLNGNTSYAGIYGPDYLKYDQYNDKKLYVPASGAVAAIFARTDTVKDPWWAPAGLRRGLIKDALQLRYKYTQGERDQLYPAQINFLQSIPGAGIALMGQKTLQAMDSALQSVNVRRLLLVLEKSMASALKYTLFEPNDPFTRSQVVQMLSSFLQDVMNRRGLYDFKVVCDETNNPPVVIDRNELHVDVYLKPVRAAEFIRLQSVITRTGASFEELIATGGNF